VSITAPLGSLSRCPDNTPLRRPEVTTPTEHRAKAEQLLELARSYAPSSAARLATLAEAQVHAILALPATDEVGTPAIPEVDAQLKADAVPTKGPAARRTRKAPTAKEAAK
jgi:hypothetical protein